MRSGGRRPGDSVSRPTSHPRPVDPPSTCRRFRPSTRARVFNNISTHVYYTPVTAVGSGKCHGARAPAKCKIELATHPCTRAHAQHFRFGASQIPYPTVPDKFALWEWTVGRDPTKTTVKNREPQQVRSGSEFIQGSGMWRKGIFNTRFRQTPAAWLLSRPNVSVRKGRQMILIRG